MLIYKLNAHFTCYQKTLNITKNINFDFRQGSILFKCKYGNLLYKLNQTEKLYYRQSLLIDSCFFFSVFKYDTEKMITISEIPDKYVRESNINMRKCTRGERSPSSDTPGWGLRLDNCSRIVHYFLRNRRHNLHLRHFSTRHVDHVWLQKEFRISQRGYHDGVFLFGWL